MPDQNQIRRRDLFLGGALLAGLMPAAAKPKDDGFRSLFDGVSLKGWTPKARSLAQPSLGRWVVEDGVIIGGQDPPGSGRGSYLVSDETFDDFELQIEANPDWPADTGILVRTIAQGNVGIQVLLDHRNHGGIGGYYGNGLFGFHAYNYGFTAQQDKDGRVTKLIPEPPSEPSMSNIHVPLDFAAPVETFIKVWKPGGWNKFRIRSVGALPHLTTWINGEKICELDTAKLQVAKLQEKGWSADAVLSKIGRAGHIALEVHSSGGKDPLGKDRWGANSVCRWRNISIKKLSA